MSKKYHINPETKEVGVCTAKIQCQYGESSLHFESVVEAHEQAEKELEETYGNLNSLEKNTVGIDYNQPSEEEFSESIPKAHRAWKTPDEYFSEGDYIKDGSEIYKVEEVNKSSTWDGTYNYEIVTNKGTFEINGYTWKESDYLDISIVSDSPNSDLLKQFPPGYTGSKLSDYVSSGDSIEYNGEVYEVKDFEYNRALLSYEVDTDQGTIYIHDDDWYHSSNIKLLK